MRPLAKAVLKPSGNTFEGVRFTKKIELNTITFHTLSIGWDNYWKMLLLL